MSRRIESFRKAALLPFLAFVFAFFIGGVIIALSDSEVLGNIKSPGKFLTSFGAIKKASSAVIE